MVTYPAHICILMADLTLETGGKGKEEAGKLGSDSGGARREGGREERRRAVSWFVSGL